MFIVVAYMGKGEGHNTKSYFAINTTCGTLVGWTVSQIANTYLY